MIAMHIVKAEENQVEKIVDISIRAFETDVNVGGAKGDCRLNLIHRKRKDS